jgi:16S rRNA (guanine527-N7)-methyltransferase
MSEAVGRDDWRRFGLDADQEAGLLALLALIERDDRAPTSIRDRAQAATAHVADSLSALVLPELGEAAALVDIGSGAGFPGLPVAVARPGAEVTLLESQRRKCVFLDEAIRVASATNARVVCARAEEWQDGARAFDAALARAVASQPVVLEYAAPLLRVGGVLVDWRGRRDEPEEAAALRAADALGMEPVRVERSEPYADAHAHHLHVFAKRTETPERFPRRPGMARKRPLGG